MVVALGDAGAAEGAVFAAGGFGESAGAAGWGVRRVWWVEERVVVGVGGHGEGVVGRANGGGAGAGEVEEDIGDRRDENDESAVEGGGEKGPGRGNEEDFGGGEENDEEDLVRWIRLVIQGRSRALEIVVR